MAVFTYKALDANGKVSKGELKADDRAEALRVLSKKGLQPVNLRESSGDSMMKGRIANSALKNCVIRSSVFKDILECTSP